MKNKVNIIIPSITISNELITCLKGINLLNYKDFIVSIVIDYDNKKKLPKLDFEIKKIIVGKVFMSRKRNLAAKKIATEYIAFIDSDCYPCKNWLKNAIMYLKDKSIHVVGGPNIPFKNQSYSEKITSFCKMSFFISGNLSYRKYKSPQKYCEDYLESCNLIMKRSTFLNCKGMNEKLYIAEDKELFKNFKMKIKNFKALFSPDVYVYHKQRKILKFLLQRLSFGTILVKLGTFKDGLNGLLPIVPIISFFILLSFLSSNLLLTTKLSFIGGGFIIINLLIFYEINKFIVKSEDKVLTLLIINLANLMHIVGGLITLFGLRKIFERKIYVLSRLNK
tara:strand:+ start:122 stop:1129 length:1008 start_codon:yes stop_codon:yes gene_type:complete